MASINEQFLSDILVKVNKTFSDYPLFIETGTYLGETSYNMSKLFERVITIEAFDALYERAAVLFKDTNVAPIHGDSVTALADILNITQTPAVFWLDGHYSGEGTFYGAKEFPIIEECTLIDAKYQGTDCLVLVDDMRLLNNMDGLTGVDILKCFINKTIVDHWYAPSSLHNQDVLVLQLNQKKQ